MWHTLAAGELAHGARQETAEGRAAAYLSMAAAFWSSVSALALRSMERVLMAAHSGNQLVS